MISQLMGQNSVMDPDFVDEVASGPSVKRAQCTMSVLNAWYKVRFQKCYLCVAISVNVCFIQRESLYYTLCFLL